MTRQGLFTLLFYVGAIALFLASFFTYSAIFFKDLHSDMAIQALMARNLDFPQDAYYWGADRFGSLVPYMAFPLVQLGVDSLLAISLVQFMIILGGLLLLIELLGKNYYTLLAFQLYALPVYPWHQQVITGHVLLQFTTFCLLFLYLMNKIINQKEPKTGLLLLFGSSAVIGWWCTEQLLVPWFVSWIMILLTKWRTKNSNFRRWKYLVPLVVLMIGSILIFWLKSAVPIGSGGGFHSLRFGWEYVSKFFATISELFAAVASFDDPWYSVYVILFAFGIFLALALSWRILERRIPTNSHSRILSVLIVTILGLLAVTLLSRWVQDRRFQIRYFIPAIYLSGLYMVFVLRTVSKRTYGAFALVLSMVSLSYLYVDQQLRFEIPHWSYDPSDMKNQTQINKASILGSYWTSYVMAAQSHPESFGTPNDQEQVRHEKSAIEVMQSDSIMVVGNRWLKQGIPDTISQFGWNLIRLSEDQKLGKLYYAYFTKESFQEEFDLLMDCEHHHLSKSGDSTKVSFTYEGPVKNTTVAKRGRIYLPPGDYSLSVEARSMGPKGSILRIFAGRWGPYRKFSTQEFELSPSWEKHQVVFTLDKSLAFFEFSLSLANTDQAELGPVQLQKIE